jgi:hypothetical protein
MAVQTVAQSISRSVSDRVFREPASSARVLAVFEHACELLIDDGEVIAVVASSIGNGPLNIVVNWDDALFAGLEPDAPAHLEQQRLRFGGLEIDLAEAVVWEPRPNWSAIRAGDPLAATHLLKLARLCRERCPDESLFRLLDRKPPAVSARSPVRGVARRALGDLGEGWKGDLTSLREGARGLAGLGGGLTPSGDDCLAGLMLRAWATHPRPRWFCRVVVETAAGLTTTLSEAFLQAAARGECSAAWHVLLAALAEGNDAALTAAATEVLSQGATSGSDMLAGFLWTETQISWG